MSKTFFADTTVVYYLLHSHTLLRDRTAEIVNGNKVWVPRFVRGEYIRGYIAGLIELYYAIKEEKTVQDGIHTFNGDASRRPRKLANAFGTTTGWLAGHTDCQIVHKTLRRLGEEIITKLTRLDTLFPNQFTDALHCEFGAMNFPEETYDESHILDFYSEIVRIKDKPDCDQCTFRRDQISRINSNGIDLYSNAQQARYNNRNGYVTQAEWIDKAIRSEKLSPSCWYCERLGDTIITLSTPDKFFILTGDHSSFPALANILNIPIQLIEPLEELRSIRAEQTKPESGDV
jgi:hypothetical protein